MALFLVFGLGEVGFYWVLLGFYGLAGGFFEVLADLALAGFGAGQLLARDV